MPTLLNDDAPVAPMTPQKQKEKAVHRDEQDHGALGNCISINTSVISQEHAMQNVVDDVNSNFSQMHTSVNSKSNNSCNKTFVSNYETSSDNMSLHNRNEQYQSELSDRSSSKSFNINQVKNINETKMFAKDRNILHSTSTPTKQQKTVSQFLAHVCTRTNNLNALARWESMCSIGQEDEVLPLLPQPVSSLSASQTDLDSVLYQTIKAEGSVYANNDNTCRSYLKRYPYKYPIPSQITFHQKSNSFGHLHSMERTEFQSSKNTFKGSKIKPNVKPKAHANRFLNDNEQRTSSNKDDYEISHFENSMMQSNRLKANRAKNNNDYSTNSASSVLEHSKTIVPSITAISDIQVGLLSKCRDLEQAHDTTLPSKIEETQSVPGMKNEGVVLHSKERERTVANLFDEMLSEENSPGASSPRLSRSIPTSPAGKRKKEHFLRDIFYSPLLLRKKWQKLIDSSDDEISADGGNARSKDGQNLEYSQNISVEKKDKQGHLKNIMTEEPPLQFAARDEKYNEYVLQNKMPLWNEARQVYQLDFGGRVTQESAKNFQVEFNGEQVLQFGRINMNAYTLDFQKPFCALQAFAVALASVTQRLK